MSEPFANYNYHNIDFVREVEKYPCIYNTNLCDYTNRDLTRQAWMAISKKLGLSVPICKSKWRKIRTAYASALKQASNSNKTTKPYYLNDHLQYLLPFMKNSSEYIQQPNSSANSEEDSSILDEQEKEVKRENDNNTEEELDDSDHDDVLRLEEKNTVYVPMPNHTPIERRALKKRRTENAGIESRPRKMFLLSLLPDVESFTDSQMRIFRRDVIRSIDNIMSKLDD